eukprot:gene9209-biopygen638
MPVAAKLPVAAQLGGKGTAKCCAGGDTNAGGCKGGGSNAGGGKVASKITLVRIIFVPGIVGLARPVRELTMQGYLTLILNINVKNPPEEPHLLDAHRTPTRMPI